MIRIRYACWVLATIFFILYPYLTALPSPTAAQIFVNGRRIDITPLTVADGRVLVPLRATAMYLGAEVRYAEGVVTLENGPRRIDLPVETLTLHDNRTYLPLETLAELLGIQLYPSGEQIYIRIPPSQLRGIAIEDNRIIIELSRFTPIQPKWLDERTLLLTLFNVPWEYSDQQVSTSSWLIERAELLRERPYKILLKLYLRYPLGVQMRRFAGESSEFVEVTIDGDSTLERSVQLDANISYHEIDRIFNNQLTELRYLKIANYSSHYRLEPTLPGAGIGSLDSLKEMVASSGGVAGINANFFDLETNIPVGLLIKDGELLSPNYERRAAMGENWDGRAIFFNPTVALFVENDRYTIPVEDVNHPLHHGELTLYSPNYNRKINFDFPVVVAKIWFGRVRQIFEVHRPSVLFTDGVSHLLIASGEAAEAMQVLKLGDKVRLTYQLDPYYINIRNAISAGPRLLQDGQLVLDPKRENFDSGFARLKTARSVIATTYQDELILLVVVQNGPLNGSGMDLWELAGFLKGLGVRDAMALDGGGSSSLVFTQDGRLKQVGQRRRVAVGLTIIPRETGAQAQVPGS
ncbi:MAG: phosphodiester glycosidase family protein [Candidatus Bipolaricaulia bacterium]